MAQYWENWQGHTVGQPPAGWTARWASGASYTIVNVPEGRALRVVISSSGDPYRVLTWDALGQHRDVDIIVLFRQNVAPFSTMTGVIGVRATATSNTGYWTSPQRGTVAQQLYLRNFKTTYAASVPFTWEADTLYWMRLRAIENNVFAAAWPASEPPPAFWTISRSLTDFPDAGLVALGGLTSPGVGPLTIEWLFVGVGTDGDPPPMGPLVEGAASISASAGLSASPTRRLVGAVAPGGTAEANISARAIYTARGSASAATDVRVSALGHRGGAVVMDARATVQAGEPFRVRGGAASPLAQAEFAAAASYVTRASARAAGESTVATMPTRILDGAASVLSAAGMAVAPTLRRLAKAALYSLASFAARAFVFGWRTSPTPTADWTGADTPDTTWTPVGPTPTDWNER